MAHALQAFLLICGFCAPVLGAFAMEIPAAAQEAAKQIFGENPTSQNTHTVNQPLNGNGVGLMDDTNRILPKSIGSHPNTSGIKSK